MNNIHPGEIGFDFDGVIANTAESFVKIAAEQYGCHFQLTDITDFDVENCINIPGETVYKIFMDIMVDSLATDVQPMPGAVQTISEITASQPVTIITARSMLEPVRDWFTHYFNDSKINERINLIAMGNHDNKVHYAQEQKLNYFIDDRAETCLQLARANFRPIVFNQPWNSGRHNLPSVSSWQDIRQLLKLNGE